MPLPVVVALLRLMPIILSAALRVGPPVVGRFFEKNDDKAYAETLRRAALPYRVVVEEREHVRIDKIANPIMHWLAVQAMCIITLQRLDVEMFETEDTDDIAFAIEICRYQSRIVDIQSEFPSLEEEYAEATSAIDPTGIRFGVVRMDRTGTRSHESLAADGKKHKENLEELLRVATAKLAVLC